MRTIVLLTFGFGLALSSGCSMCAPGLIDDYATVGGKWQRSDPTQGRVGSIFSDPGTTITAGATAQHMVDSHAVGPQSEYFGEAHTEGYQGTATEYGAQYDGEYYEQQDDAGYSEFAPEMNHGSDGGLQFDDQTITLGEEW